MPLPPEQTLLAKLDLRGVIITAMGLTLILSVAFSRLNMESMKTRLQDLPIVNSARTGLVNLAKIL